MSANVNRASKKRVLAVVASPSTHATLGYPVGFWASELAHPWLELEEAGYEITLASPRGGKVEVDAYSDPAHESGYSKEDFVSRGFLASPEHAALLASTKRLADVDHRAFDAIWVAGGQSPMFTFREDADLHKAVRETYEAGKPTALVCHATSVLLDVRLSNGRLLAEGKQVTGFANSEEDFVDQAMGTKVMPFRIEDEAKKRGIHFVTAPAFRPFAVRDGNLITGQQQYSGREAAKLLVEALGR